MPLYEYRCLGCGAEFEKLMRIGADAPACGACGSASERKVSRTSFRLTGSGWYATDYASGSGTKASSASEATPGNDAGEGGGASSESSSAAREGTTPEAPSAAAASSPASATSASKAASSGS